MATASSATRRWFARAAGGAAAATLLMVAACASGRATLDGGDEDDAGGGGGADAAEGAIDAPAGGLDGGGPGGTPDAAAMGTPDAAPPACSPCTLVPQCGCGAMEACDLDGTMLPSGGTTCRAVTAPGMGASTCTGVTTCAAGWVCLGPSGGSACYEYCTSDSQCDGMGGLCTVEITYGSPPMPVPGAKVCSPNCTVVSSSPAGCPTGWGCHVYYNSDEARHFTWCTKTGGGGQESPCTTDEDCQAGYSCVNAGGNKCLKNCNKTTNTGCAGLAGTSCVGYSTPAVIAGTEYGACWDGT